MKLNDKQKRFCDEYLIDLNATQAAIRAGYNAKCASQFSYQLLQKTLVQERISELMNDRSERTKIDADWVLTELITLAQTNLSSFLVREEGKRPYFDLSKATDDQLAALDEIQVDSIGSGNDLVIDKVKLKKPSKLKVLELIGKHISIGAFKETVDNKHSFIGPDGKPMKMTVNINFVKPGEASE